jgi:EAL domain-containing protein (putative c-di-GMP-specific phosphodiesterase class I)
MSDTEPAAVKLRALRELGVGLVVDNFATAYSSLPHLGPHSMNFLNIDRSFTVQLGVEPEDTAIVSAMINLAHSLGWEVTPEELETADQLARLRGTRLRYGPRVLPLEAIEQRPGFNTFLEEVVS